VIPDSHPIYPARSFIRFQAKNQIIADLTGEEITSFVHRPGAVQEQGTTTPNPDWRNSGRIDIWSENPADSSRAQDQRSQMDQGSTAAPSLSFDEALFGELTKTAFHPDRHPELYQPCDSQVEARAIESQVVAELVKTYEQIVRNQADEQVQRLNALL